VKPTSQIARAHLGGRSDGITARRQMPDSISYQQPSTVSGEAHLGAFLCLAGLAHHLGRDDNSAEAAVSIEQLAAWVTAMAIATEPTINDLLRRGLDPTQPLEVALMARHAATTFTGVAKEDHKIRSSIYATAALALDPWLEPAVAHSASDSPRPFYWSDGHYPFRPRHIDLDWLMAGDVGRANTLYLTASQPEFERLSPVLGGLLADLKDAIHAWDIAGRRLGKPLLVVIDEAGQLELGWLPAEVSTIAVLGAFFVTCWQNLSQIQHRYTSLADAVLSGHRTKCFFAGIDDLTTVRYLSGLLGHEYVTRWSTSRDVPPLLGGGHHRRSVSETVQRDEFAPANTLRQMYPGEAVLLHGTLPPVHLDAVRWWHENDLKGLVPLDHHGNPKPPDGLPTCPLTGTEAGEPRPVVDPATLQAALAQLPEPAKGPSPERGGNGPVAGASRPSGSQPVRAEVADPPAKRPVPAGGDQVTGRCDLCGHRLRPGESALDQQGRRTIIRCAPTCISRHRSNGDHA
jgi:TraM recognition site of TraD and TraG